MDQMDLTDVYRAFHPATVQYTFFSAAYGTFSKIDQILTTTNLRYSSEIMELRVPGSFGYFPS
jgi:exonuclease III